MIRIFGPGSLASQAYAVGKVGLMKRSPEKRPRPLAASGIACRWPPLARAERAHDGAGSLKLQLGETQTSKAIIAGMAISVVIVGDPAAEGAIIVLANAGALRPGDTVSLNRDAFTAGPPQAWTAV